MRDDIDTLNAEFTRLGAGLEMSAERSDGTGGRYPGPWVVWDHGAGGLDEAYIAHPSATLAALRALPDDAGPQSAWDAL